MFHEWQKIIISETSGDVERDVAIIQKILGS